MIDEDDIIEGPDRELEEYPEDMTTHDDWIDNDLTGGLE